jgi:hypothetical protein
MEPRLVGGLARDGLIVANSALDCREGKAARPLRPERFWCLWAKRIGQHPPYLTGAGVSLEQKARDLFAIAREVDNPAAELHNGNRNNRLDLGIPAGFHAELCIVEHDTEPFTSPGPPAILAEGPMQWKQRGYRAGENSERVTR